jgi:anti-sigma factor ChrR (cupin superfamily)
MRFLLKMRLPEDIPKPEQLDSCGRGIWLWLGAEARFFTIRNKMEAPT